MRLIIIGTSRDAHLRLTSPYVSGYHAELLLLDNGDILLTDKASRNGTFVNEERISPNKEVSVKRGDTIRFADTVLDWTSVPMLETMRDVREIRGIGTNFKNRYQLQGDKVSRFHATLKLKKDKKWYIQDHSRNGTTVNGIPVTPNQDVKLRKSDRILCAGVECPNPYNNKKGGKGNRRDFPWRWIFGGIGIAAAISLIVFLAGNLKGCRKIDVKPEMSDVQLYDRYKNSTVLMVGFYHYKVSAGNLNLESLGLPTDVVLAANGNLVPVNGDQAKMHGFTGTGFFVSDDGMIITNLHIAKPWLFTDEGSQISDKYKLLLAEMAAKFPQLNAFTDQIKVDGEVMLSYIPNGEYFTNENLRSCREIAAGDDTNVDVALLQTVNRKLPDESSTFVSVSDFVTNDSDIKVGEHIYTMGFPLGLNAQDLDSSNGIQLLARGGNITQESNEYSFGFDAASYNGASGSPIFNDKGQLVGILNAGFEKSQGFNYGIKAIYAKELIDQKTKHQ